MAIEGDLPPIEYLLELYYPSFSPDEITEPNRQEYNSHTFYVTFEDEPPVVLHLRRPDEPLDAKVFEQARAVLGTFVPSLRLISDDRGYDFDPPLLVYEMSRIPGISIASALKRDDKVSLLPNLAYSLGAFFSKCCTSSKTDGLTKSNLKTRLEKAVSSTDPLLVPFKADFADLLGKLDQLDCLPLAIDNANVSPTTVFVDPVTGAVTGMVDWKYLDRWPFGFLFNFVHLLRGEGFGDNWKLRSNGREIEIAFWKGVFETASPELRLKEKVTQLEVSMRIGTAVMNSVGGTCSAPFRVGQLRMEFDYRIPVELLG